MSLDVTLMEVKPTEVFWSNITHNLGKMAKAAGIYEALWRPEEIGVTTAKQLIPILKDGLVELKSNPEYYKTFNPENGCGHYEGLIAFVTGYIQGCEEHPDAIIEISR